VFTLVSGLIWTIAPVRANGSAEHEAAFLSQANGERSAAARAAYAGAADLVEVARRHSQRMAAEGRLHHNPALSSEVQGWQAVGENVGVGASVDSIHRALMDSPTHRDNLLSGTFTEAGMGVHVDGDGTIWVTQVFRQPATATAAPGPAPAGALVDADAATTTMAVPAPSSAGGGAALSDAGADVAELAASFAATASRAAPAARLSTVNAPTSLGSTVAESAGGDVVGAHARRVTVPIGVAASFLLAVVLGLLAEVGRYPLSDWRRQRSQASISSSRSPSSTAWTLPVS